MVVYHVSFEEWSDEALPDSTTVFALSAFESWTGGGQNSFG